MADEMRVDRRPRDYGRRDFLRMGAWLGVGTAVLSGPARAEPVQIGSRKTLGDSEVRRVRLGKTGVEVSDIGFGTFALRDTQSDVELVQYALDRGI
ncbi:MAG: hypothetical protein P8M78_01080, partial [Myxococcota bacterium]|nr:hypothetical protein [Myxococcota bacterium]